MATTYFRYSRVPTVCTAQAGFVANRLAGAGLHTLPGGRVVVPLLHPQAHGLPFLLTLELHPAVPGGTAPAAPPPPPLQLDRSLYTLHYVLGGAGELVRGSGGGGEPLQAGDAVLTHFGGAACRAAPPGAAAAEEAGAANLLAGSPWQLAELVAYLPRQLFEAEQQAAAAQQQLDAQRAGTQVLHAAGLQPLLLGAAGRSSGGGAAAVQPLPGEFVDALLAGARDTARKALLLHDEEHGGVAAGQASTGSGPAAGGGSPAAGGLLQRAARAAASSLAAWWEAQQQRACPVAKRTLAELTAFRLPNQSNRLAVQFDPFSLPQVPFISGIEVFERGHRTTPHVHPRAHELFFILAGEGVGFCGDQRFPVRAGDVVVFRPGSVHGIDNGDGSRMYCLEAMFPNESFAEMVRSGEDTGGLTGEDLCQVAHIGCR
ncbi:cupin [Micractinium conductrix]|uniref:Cupin n=1 Tax=Micractinium conductrix TaxID=554055 RepID=A0A2P6VC28_9CHLO|nr:cupin [Micractinium conductrix]|eukprot:PSC71611.1 cupin [Micractinium conductrix]